MCAVIHERGCGTPLFTALREMPSLEYRVWMIYIKEKYKTEKD